MLPHLVRRLDHEVLQSTARVEDHSDAESKPAIPHRQALPDCPIPCGFRRGRFQHLRDKRRRLFLALLLVQKLELSGRRADPRDLPLMFLSPPEAFLKECLGSPRSCKAIRPQNTATTIGMARRSE